MARIQTQSISQEKFLLVAVNLLHKAFVVAPRTEAKSTYTQIAAGKTAHLTMVQMADDAMAGFDLSLAHSEFQGRLSYSAFRSSVTTLIGNITRALREKKDLKVFNALNGGSAMIFGITAVTVQDDQANVMVLAADPGEAGASTTLQLMYLDPAQFSGQRPPARADRKL